MEPQVHVFAMRIRVLEIGIMRRETKVVVKKMDGCGCNVEAVEAIPA
jgi:hypothetical protein